MRSTGFRYHHHVSERQKCSCNLLTSTLIVIIFANISILASASASASKDLSLPILTQIPSKYQSITYQNIRLGFKLDYPNNWMKISEINRNNNYSSVLFVTPENQFPNLKSLFSVTVEKFALFKQNATVILQANLVPQQR